MLSTQLLSETVLTEPHRLAIVVALAFRSRTFVEVRGLVGLTDGNLNRHLDKLARENLIAVQREKAPGARPRTLISLTTAGRARLAAHVDLLDDALSQARAALVEGESTPLPTGREQEAPSTVAPLLVDESPGAERVLDLVSEHFAGPD